MLLVQRISEDNVVLLASSGGDPQLSLTRFAAKV